MSIRLFKAGNVGFDTGADGLHLYMPSGTLGLTAGNVNTLYKQDGTSQNGVKYAIAAGKTFYATLLTYCPISAAAQIEIGYADNALDNAAPAGLTNRRVLTGQIGGLLANVIYQIPIFMTVPTGKCVYLMAITGNTPCVSLDGVEI